MKKKKIVSITALTVALSVLPSIPGYAKITPDTSNDGFTLWHYEETEDTSAKDETEKLYDERPQSVRRMEYLNRGLTAVPADDGVLISWRYLGTDSKDLYYNLYRNGTKINTAPINASNFFDASGKPGDDYTLIELENGEETDVKSDAKAWDKEYIGFDVKKYDTGNYIIDDGAVGDLDGDGDYELILRRIPSDMNVETRVAYPIIEAYELTGEHMWTINIGPNEINEHDLNMMVYDFNGDGKSEVIMRSFEGTTDGAGNTITGADGKVKDYTEDANNLAIFTDRQYIVSTPEYLSMYDGQTGAEITRTDLLPSQTPLSEWSYNYSDTGRLTKRASHHLFGLAYLDGVTPSFVEVRGAWDNVRAAAWHIEDNKFVLDWEANTPNTPDNDSIYGAANHNLTVVDVDFDGKDEILSGPMALDHDGTTMYAVKAEDSDGNVVKLLHGDAFDVAKMTPDYDGYYVWACHETKNLPANIELHDARTGQVLFGWGKNKDTGRSRAADIDPTYRGYEMWGSTGTIPVNVSGKPISDTWNEFYVLLPDGSFENDEQGNEIKSSIPMNFKIYWDGDLLSEMLDGTRISKWDWNNQMIQVILDADGCASNCGTKAVPCVAADLFGDWRDEVVWKTADESGIRIYSTNIETPYKIPTLMHDYYYRASVAMQNNHYNQPANVSYYLGAETTQVPTGGMYTIKDGQEIRNPDTSNSVEIYVGYAKRAASELKLLINSPYAYSDTEIIMIDTDDNSVVPTIVNDNTLVPLRFISENFGMEVDWNETERKVTAKGNDREIVMTIDSTGYTVNGEQYTLETAPQIMHERTMLPLRAIAEALGKKVFWDDRGLIVIGNSDFTDTSSVNETIEILKTGKEPEPAPVATPQPTPDPTAAPDPWEKAEYTEKNIDGTTYKIYVDEDYSAYNTGDPAGWAGTKPAPMGEIGVVSLSGNNAISLGGTDKGNRNAVYNLSGPMKSKVYISLDWTVGDMTGGSSVGELRFADSSGNVFLSFQTQSGQELKYNFGGKISNGGLETLPWQDVGKGLTGNGTVHIEIFADFQSSTLSAKLTQGNVSGEIKDMKFENASDFSALEVLAIRNEKNWEWSTQIDNMIFGFAA